MTGVSGIEGPLLARSNEEVYVFLDLNPCTCGGGDASRDSSLRLVGEEWFARYSCVCAGCGATRELEFRQPDTLVPAPPGGWASGDEPSELLDAGQWLWVSDMFASAPGSPDGLSAEQVSQAGEDLRLAASAVDEVLKFIPDEIDEVPGVGFWTDQGERLWRAEPERFRRQRLERARDRYRALAAEFR